MLTDPYPLPPALRKETIAALMRLLASDNQGIVLAAVQQITAMDQLNVEFRRLTWLTGKADGIGEDSREADQ